MKKIYLFTIMGFLFTNCGKDFLDIKRDANQVVPSSIMDYQAILDYNDVMNNKAAFELSFIGADEYILTDDIWNTLNLNHYTHIKNGYIWAKDIYEGKEVNEWNWAYERIMYANLVLQAEITSFNENEEKKWENIQGQALFYRAFTFYQLAQVFCKPYNVKTAQMDLGIPLRKDYDVSVRIGRGTLQEVYDLIIDDLIRASEMMPDSQINNYRPSKLAAYALLARIYRDMNKLDLAFEFANKVLLVKNELLNYNNFLHEPNFAFNGLNKGLDNKEIIFFCHTGSLIRTRGKLSEEWKTQVFDEEWDLRNTLFFDGTDFFTGSYSGGTLFTGLAVDEQYLIRAEGYLNKDQYEEAKKDLDYLRINRFRENMYSNIKTDVKEEIYELLKKERKKQLFLRGVRWSDLRRDNLDPRTAKNLDREVNNKIYVLEPNDLNWVWPIPESEVRLADIKQNERH